jgi:ATP-dependent RNA helicase HelY
MSADSGRRDRFVSNLGFEPDDFQLLAFDGVDDGENVIVAAPTGAGKTLVADYAIDKVLHDGRRVFYTTPIKALSNQKYLDLCERLGRDQVGLLTGDNTINGEADVVVMTTEVLRNMLYAGSDLDRLTVVVLDEVHYLQDAYRGPVWEEVIIHLPRRIRLVCLSATVSNADELAAWIETVRGRTRLVMETRRPVELTNLYMVGERSGARIRLMPTARGSEPNPKGFRFDNPGLGRPRNGNRNDRRDRPKWATPRRLDVISELKERDLLPAIYFIFSRAGCDDAARSVAATGLKLTTRRQRQQIAAIIDHHVRRLDQADLEVLDFVRFRRGLLAGIAAHHAGMVPPFKEAVEACFIAGLIKVVFATETLALGVNMPARTVVIEKLTKFTGETHEFLTPAQYTQLTGRAGRRGIDTHGQAVVLWSPFVAFEQVANLALSREFVLRSSFRPTYNMAANLVRRYSPARARHLLNLSFAQYRIDSGVVEHEHRIERLEERRRKQINRIEADFGPVEDLRAASITPSRATVDEQAIAFALAHLSPGDVIRYRTASEGRPGVERHTAAVLSVAFRRKGRIRVAVVDSDGDTYDLVPREMLDPPDTVGRLDLPEPYLPNSVTFAHEVSQRLRNQRVAKGNASRGRSGAGADSPDRPPMSKAEVSTEARRALKRLEKIERQLTRAQEDVSRRADSLAGQFDRVIELLEDRGHLDGWALTSSGQRVARLYHESDLLVAECLDAGFFDGLSGPELAALASVFVFEERRSSAGPIEPWYPSADIRRRFRQIQARHLDLNGDETGAGLTLTRAPDPGFIAVAHGWASGVDLDDILEPEELTAGDFIRTTKQLIDLLRQIGQLAPDGRTAAVARSAADLVHRDLVAASSMLDTDDTVDRADTDDIGDTEDTMDRADTDDTGDTADGDGRQTGGSDAGAAAIAGDGVDADVGGGPGR